MAILVSFILHDAVKFFTAVWALEILESLYSLLPILPLSSKIIPSLFSTVVGSVCLIVCSLLKRAAAIPLRKLGGFGLITRLVLSCLVSSSGIYWLLFINYIFFIHFIPALIHL